jgi:DNA polymerase I-like protein with 3'-5' exonuclease and polymerase domains
MESFPEIPDWIRLEMSVQEVLTRQELHGWAFDEKAAQELEITLRKELDSLIANTKRLHPYVPGVEFTPKVNSKLRGYVKGAPFTKIEEFNPSSRDHVAWAMSQTGWKPSQFTDTGKPVIDEVVLKEVGTEEALAYLRILELTKLLGMLNQGQNAWLRLVQNGRIYHRCYVNTNTHRCVHQKPNLSQVPSIKEFQQLFVASPGLTLVGADLSGIELRMLAHYLSRYDDGKYADVLINGDIHQVNADKIGISRKQVKTVTYAFLYGAGDVKIGHSFDPLLSEPKAKKKGAEIRAAYVAAIDGLAQLLDDIKRAAGRGYVKAIDGRQIKVDAQHKALNYLLQSSAGVVAKRWMVDVEEIASHQFKAHQLAFIHDALFYECTADKSADLKFLLEYAAKEAGEYYKLRCPVDAVGHIGPDFYSVH